MRRHANRLEQRNGAMERRIKRPPRRHRHRQASQCHDRAHAKARIGARVGTGQSRRPPTASPPHRETHTPVMRPRRPAPTSGARVRRWRDSSTTTPRSARRRLARGRYRIAAADTFAGMATTTLRPPAPPRRSAAPRRARRRATIRPPGKERRTSAPTPKTPGDTGRSTPATRSRCPARLRLSAAACESGDRARTASTRRIRRA